MKYVISMLVASVLLASCGAEKVEPTEEKGKVAKVQNKEEREAEIAEMEQAIKGFGGTKRNPTLDSKADLLVKRYRDYVAMNPRDSMSAEYLMRGADLSVGLGQPKAAITMLDRLISDFPDYRKVVEMMLYRGFIYESQMNDYANAVKSYQALIDRYPNHRLAADAKASIENLSMTEEELIEKFKKQNEQAEG